MSEADHIIAALNAHQPGWWFMGECTCGQKQINNFKEHQAQAIIEALDREDYAIVPYSKPLDGWAAWAKREAPGE